MKNKFRITVFLIALIVTNSFSQNSKYVDSLKSLTTSKIDTVRFWAFSELVWELQYTDKNAAIEYSAKLTQQAQKVNNKKWEAQGLNDQGIVNFGSGELDLALKNFQRSLEIRRKLGDKKDIASSLSKIAVIKTEKAQYGEALKIQLEVLQLYENMEHKLYIAHTCNNIGALYTNINNYVLSNQYFKRAYVIEKVIDNKPGLSITLAGVGNNYEELGNYDSAIVYLNGAKMLFKEIGDLRNYAAACHHLSLIYRKEHNLVKARESCQIAIAIAEEIADSAGLVLYQSCMANIFVEEDRYAEAEPILLNSLNVSQRLGQDEAVLSIYRSLTRLYIKMKNTEKAFLFFGRYTTAKDSVFSAKTSKLYSEEQTKFDVAKKDLELKAQGKEIEKEKAQRNLIFAALLFFVLIAAIAIWAFIQKRKGNKQIQLKNSLLEKANEEISHQKEKLSVKQKEVVDSINYAKKIQDALLANEEFLLGNSIDHFVLFKPKDIVSGDFTWATKNDDFLYLACCDSTGHGVPGAFMSLLSMGFLSEAIKERNISEPGKIFDYVRARLIETIGKDEQKDGFDGILLQVDLKNKKYTYAAANNNPLLVHNGELQHLPSNKMPVGQGIKTDAFETFNLDAQSGDSIYMFTDGYPDQFGGPKGKKLKYKQLEELLVKNHSMSLNEQKQTLHAVFETWKGNLEQIDDVCVVGIKV